MDHRAVMETAHQHGAESVRLEHGVVHVAFREFDEHREVGFLEVRVDYRVRLLDYRQSPCDVGRRWGVGVSAWMARVNAALRGPSHTYPGAHRSHARAHCDSLLH